MSPKWSKIVLHRGWCLPNVHRSWDATTENVTSIERSCYWCHSFCNWTLEDGCNLDHRLDQIVRSFEIQPYSMSILWSMLLFLKMYRSNRFQSHSCSSHLLLLWMFGVRIQFWHHKPELFLLWMFQNREKQPTQLPSLQFLSWIPTWKKPFKQIQAKKLCPFSAIKPFDIIYYRISDVGVKKVSTWTLEAEASFQRQILSKMTSFLHLGPDMCDVILNHLSINPDLCNLSKGRVWRFMIIL